AVVLQALLAAVLCVGFSFTFMTERFPNFAHVSIVNMGAFFSFFVVYFVGLNPYLSMPVAVILSGLLGALLYLVVARPLTRRGRSVIYLTLAFLAASWVMNSTFMAIRYWALMGDGIRNTAFRLSAYDLKIFGVPASWVFLPASCVLVVTGLYLFLTRNRLGLSLRAVSENEELAMILGVDTFRAHLASWVIGGALAGFAGFSTALLQGVNPLGADALLVTVMAGSFLGGVGSVPGAAIGGFTLVVVQSYVVDSIRLYLGNRPVIGFLNNLQLLALVGLLPSVVIWCILLFEPDSIAGILARLQARLRAPPENASVTSDTSS
ncbi:TPA: branched-chain amino acid ABC transporter permease, partial [Candidatus Bathyarchaeota archaeon]|nr:branched-chain amino acid ABC transporter permease [Candidatus Bathyarchaeota archaeon]